MTTTESPAPPDISNPARRPVRVLQVVQRFFPELGGLETHVAEVTRRLAERADVEVTVLTTDRTGELPGNDEVDAVPVLRRRSWPRNRDYYISPGIVPVIARGDWDVVHLQGVHTFVPPVGMLSALGARVPYVLTFHSGGHSSSGRDRVRAAQWKALTPLLARSAQLIAVSRFERDRFSRATGIPPERFVVIQNGGALPPPATGVRPVPGRLVSSGRLEWYKGHHRAIEALPLVRRRVANAELVVLGGGPYEQNLRDLVAGVGMQDAVQFRQLPPSDRTAMADELASASVMVALSSYEAHPVAIMEAVASGLPVLGFDVAGTGDLVQDGLVTGLPPDSSTEQIADAIVTMLTAHHTTQRRTRPDLELPTWETCTESLAAVYHQVADSGVGRRGAGTRRSPR